MRRPRDAASQSKLPTRMKVTRILLTIVSTFALAAGVFAADEDTPLTKEMTALNKNLRTLKRQIADGSKKEENLKLIDTIKKHFDTAKDMEPASTKDQPADKKAAYVAKYKEEIAATVKDFDALAEAVKGDKADEAKTILDKLQKDKEQGHKDYRVDDK